jgi:hypothetical protein
VTGLQIRAVAVEEQDRAGEIVIDAYRSLGDVGDEFYEPVLRDIAGRAETGDVLVAELDGEVVGCVTVSFGSTALSGCKRVRLDTRTSMKSAQRLYERLGFRRDPQHDWSPADRILLLAYVLDL